MKKKLHRAQRGRREDHSATGEAPGMTANARRRLDRVDLVSGAAIASTRQRFDVHHHGLGKDLRSVFLRQIQVAKVERIFRAMPAAHHATTALDAGGSGRTFAPEERIGESLAADLSLRRLENADLRAVESVPYTGGFRSLLQKVVGWAEDSVFRHTQH